MNRQRLRLSGKYFRNIMIWTSFATALLVLTMALILFANAQGILLQQENTSNLQVFDQVKINIDMMDTMSSNLCKYLYLNSDVESVLYAQTEDVINETARINRVAGTAISANSFIHSITFYNSNLQKFLNAGQPLFFDDPLLIALANHGSPLPKARAIIRPLQKVVGGKTIDETVFSYFMYSMTDPDKLDGALVINVRSDWFLDNVRQISQIGNVQSSQVFALTDAGGFIEAGTEQTGLQNWLKTSLQAQIAAGSEPTVGSFQDKYADIGYLVSYARLDSMGVTILKVQELTAIFQSIRDLQRSVLIITVILLLIAGLFAIVLSRLIYRPVGRLVRQIASHAGQAGPTGLSARNPDEIAFLSDIYNQTLTRLDDYSRDSQQDQGILRQYWLNRLITRSQSIPPDELATLIEEGHLVLDHNRPVLACVLLIDNYRDFQRLYDAKYQEIIKFALLNIAVEVLSESFASDGLDLKDDRLVILATLPSDGPLDHTSLRMLSERIQQYAWQYFKVSLSLGFSAPVAAFSSVTDAWQNTADYLTGRRFIQGHNCLAFQDEPAAGPTGPDKSQLESLTSHLAKTIRERSRENLDAAQDILQHLFTEIARLDYDSALISLISLASTLHHAQSESGRPAGQSGGPDFSSACRHILDQETLAGIKQYFQEWLDDWYTEAVEPAVPSHNRFIMDAAGDYIRKHYADSTLSLTSLSALLNLPPRRLSKIFKEETGLSVADYLNNVRLAQAASLLEGRNLNIADVAVQVGIDNETYFYGLFKKKYGLTPKAYAFRHIAKRSGESAGESYADPDLPTGSR